MLLGAGATYRFYPLQPQITRPPAQDALFVCGQAIIQGFAWKPPYPVLRLVAGSFPGALGGMLILTAEQPGGPQPMRSHLYLAAPEFGNRKARLLSPEPDYNFWDVSVGDVDGDGKQEVALCTYSQTARDPNFARRFFVYKWDRAGDLEPLWRGSKLCRPYITAALADIAGDDAAELVSVEKALSGKLIVVAYRWNQFGFWGLGHTAEYDAIGAVTPVREAGGKALRIKARRGWCNREVLWRP